MSGPQVPGRGDIGVAVVVAVVLLTMLATPTVDQVLQTHGQTV